MDHSDYQGVYKYKVLIFLVIISIIVCCIIGHLFYYQVYIRLFFFFQTISLIKLAYYALMAGVVMRQTMRILDRVEHNKHHHLETTTVIHHAIVLPIYLEPLQLIQNALQFLASHAKAKQNYMIFLAIEQRSPDAELKGKQLKQKFSSWFRLFVYTIHTLKKGETPGKASNEQHCLIQMENIFKKQRIDPQKVMFSSIDSDNLMPEAYFQEMELFLSKHDCNIHKYMFGANQMYSINSAEVPMFNRVTDFTLGAVIFMWSANPTHTQAVMSNYSLSYKSFKQIGFFDLHPDSTGDDLYLSAKVLWKSQGDMEMIHIPIHTNMASLETGQGYLADLKARFWQAERHMRAFYVTTYNLNYFFRVLFKLKTFLSVIFYLEFEFLNVGNIIAIIIHTFLKTITGAEFTVWQQFINLGQFVIMFVIHLFYFLSVRRTAKVMYQEHESVSIWRLVQSMVCHHVVLLFNFILAKLVATLKAPFTESHFNTAPKKVSSKESSREVPASKETKPKSI